MAINKNKINDNALKYIQKGQIKKAIKEYEKILADDPSDVRTQLKKGDLLVRVGDKPQAVDTYLIVANAYSQQGFHLKAVAVFKQILKIDDARIDVNQRLAEEYQNLGIVGDAMSHLQIVAAYYDQQGMIRESLDVLRRIVDLDPDNIASRIKLAELYSREDLNAEAIEEFTQAADALKRDNRIEDYIKVAERLIYHDANNVPLIKELANIYLQRGDTKRALGKLQICFKSDSRDLETLSLLAMAFQELNQLSKTVSVHKEMAKIYEEQGQVAEMQEVYRRILEIAPDDQDASQALGYQAGAPAQQELVEAPVEPSVPAVTMPTAQDYVPEEVEPELSLDEGLDLGDGEDLMTMEAMRPEPAFDEQDATMANQTVTAAQQQAPSSLSEQAREMISKLLTETDVYIKYGLHNKAYEHLNKVFAEDPNNIEAHDKLKELYIAAGQNDHACQELSTLVQLSVQAGRMENARDYLRALLTLDPAHPNGPALEAMLSQEAPVGEVAADESFDLAPDDSPEVMIADDSGVVEVAEDDGFDDVDVTLDFDDVDDFPVDTQMAEDDEQFTAPAGPVLDDPGFDDPDDVLGLDVAGQEMDPLAIEPDLAAEDPAQMPGLEDVDELLSAVDGGDFDGVDMGDDFDDDEEEASTRIADLSDFDFNAPSQPEPVAEGPSVDEPVLEVLDDYGAGEETVNVEHLDEDILSPDGLTSEPSASLSDLDENPFEDVLALDGSEEAATGFEDAIAADDIPVLDDVPALDDLPPMVDDDLEIVDDVAVLDDVPMLDDEVVLDEVPVLDDAAALDDIPDLGDEVVLLDDGPDAAAADLSSVPDLEEQLPPVDHVPDPADDLGLDAIPDLDDSTVLDAEMTDPVQVDSASDAQDDQEPVASELALDAQAQDAPAGGTSPEPELIEFDDGEEFFADDSGAALDSGAAGDAPIEAESAFETETPELDETAALESDSSVPEASDFEEDEPATQLHMPSMTDGSTGELPPEGLAESEPPPADDMDEPEPAVASPALEDDSELEDGLEEVEFFIQQNLLDEASDVLETLKENYQDNPDVQALAEKMDRLLKGEAPVAQVSPEDLGDSFDLAAEIEREVGDDLDAGSVDDEFQYSVDDVFSEFKKGVEKVVEKEDSATHFDLGIAYKEMGLIDDAISEFTVAAQDGSRSIASLTMIGICQVERTLYSEAINTFKDALHNQDLDDQEATGLYYEIGTVYELLKDQGEALFYFKKVYKRDPKFRDVKARLKVLVKALGGKKGQGKKSGDQDSSGQDKQTSKKDKISYM